MLKLFYSQTFFKKFRMSKPLFANIVWQCIFHYNKNNNPFHNFKNALRVVHSVNYFSNNLITLRRIFGEKCLGACNCK